MPDYDKYNLLLWYNNRNDIELLNEKLSYDKPVFLITNIDSIMYKEKTMKNSILSEGGQGHAAAALYSTLAEKKYFNKDKNE